MPRTGEGLLGRVEQHAALRAAESRVEAAEAALAALRAQLGEKLR